MRIQHNIMAMNAYRNYTNNVTAMQKNLEKLSSGYKINRAGDDAAGLAISEKMRAQITGLETAQKNAKDGISLVQTAEGALTEVHDMLNRMVTLATQSANGTYDNETDRAQLQKELDQLRSEIDRIADSSNFNGIKLLDGTAGFNQDAFTVSSAAATAATGGEKSLANAFPTAPAAGATTATGIHLGKEGNTKEIDPEFCVDLGDLQFDVSKEAATVTVSFKIAGQNISVDLTSKGGTNTDGKYSTSDIATALRTAILSTTGSSVAVDNYGVTTGGTATQAKFGDFVFTVGGSGNEIKFTFAGVNADPGGATTGWVQNGSGETDKTFSEAQANNINTLIGKEFTVDASAITTGEVRGDVYHDTLGVKQAQAITDSQWAGMDVDLTNGGANDIVKQSNVLTIDGKAFIFKTDKNLEGDALAEYNRIKTATSATEIDVSKFDTEADQIHYAVDLLSQQTTTKFKIESAGSTKIHIDQIRNESLSSISDFDTYAELTSTAVIKLETPTTAAKNVGTSVTGVASKIKDGDVVNIDDKKFIFTEDMSGKTDSGDVYYIDISDATKKSQAMETLYNKAQTVFGASNVELNSGKDTVTVRAANVRDDAPVVRGKGMTLQIGDTAESFNQLTVELKNCHTYSMGIDDISIADQASAAKAVDAIKSAINYVSDVRGTLGATQNRLEHTINNLSVMTENIQDAESSIRDTDIAEEMMAYTKNNILIQSAQAMLAQANQVPQGVLQLLQ